MFQILVEEQERVNRNGCSPPFQIFPSMSMIFVYNIKNKNVLECV